MIMYDFNDFLAVLLHVPIPGNIEHKVILFLQVYPFLIVSSKIQIYAFMYITYVNLYIKIPIHIDAVQMPATPQL